MSAPRNTARPGRNVIGLGFLPDEAQHGFVVEVPKGPSEMVRIFEHRGGEVDRSAPQFATGLRPTDPRLRVLIDRTRWQALAPGFWDEANRRLRANGLPTARYVRAPTKPIPVHPSLGKELCVLCWAVEDAPQESVANALLNWEVLAPEERWWLFTMTVATTGQALQKNIGWRRALRHALADNPFVRGEGVSPRARREMLGHSQLSLDL